MRLKFAIPAVVALSALCLSLFAAPFAFPIEGQSVYQWPDSRITALMVASILTLLVSAATITGPRVRKVTSVACLGLSGLVFLLFLVFNFGTNAPDGRLPQLFSAQAAMNAMNIMDEMRLSPVYGLAIQTIAWFIALLASFFSLRLSRGLASASSDTLLLASSLLATYALGVCLVIPQWSARAIVDMQNGTFLSWFSNEDLLVAATAFSALLCAVRLRKIGFRGMEATNRPEKP